VKCDGVTNPDAVPVREDDGTIDAERTAFGIDHCAIGYQFATRNGLPDNVVRVTLNHHRPKEEHFQRDLVALVAVAENVANHVQREHNIAGYGLEACPHYEVLASGWKQKRENAFATALPAAVVQAIRDTRHMLKSIA
jgi:HD-like signal output (HDOD) protein